MGYIDNCIECNEPVAKGRLYYDKCLAARRGYFGIEVKPVHVNIVDSPAEYRRKMNTPWEDPSAHTAFLNRSPKDLIDSLDKLSEGGDILFIKLPIVTEEEEVQVWEEAINFEDPEFEDGYYYMR